MDGIIIEGFAKRESLVLPGVVNLRYFVLVGGQGKAPILRSYRNQGDPSPSKTWPLSSNASISNIEVRDVSIRRSGESIFAVLTAKLRGKTTSEKSTLVSLILLVLQGIHSI